jgi:hypothetical protein
MRKFATVLLASLFVIGVAACGGGSSTKTLKTPNGSVKVNGNGSKIQFKDKNGSVSIGGGSLPEGFPKSDVPLPSTNTKDIVTSSSSSVGGKQRWSITYNASGKNAAKDYLSKLKDAGFMEQGSSSAGGSSAGGSFSSATLSKGKYEVNVIGTSASGANTLTIAVSPNSSSDTSTT